MGKKSDKLQRGSSWRKTFGDERVKEGLLCDGRHVPAVVQDDSHAAMGIGCDMGVTLFGGVLANLLPQSDDILDNGAGPLFRFMKVSFDIRYAHAEEDEKEGSHGNDRHKLTSAPHNFQQCNH